MKIIFEHSVPEYISKWSKQLEDEAGSTEELLLYMPVGKGSAKRLKELVTENSYTNYLQLPGAEFVADKKWLWISLVRTFGRSSALKLLPETWVLENELDRSSFKNEIAQDPKSYFFLKSNKQKRKGLALLRSDKITEDVMPDFVVAQRPCETVRLNDRSFHIRAYMILDYREGCLKAHFLNDGKVLYSEPNGKITDASLDVYDVLPKYLSQFSSLGLPYLKPETLSKGMMFSISKVVQSIRSKIEERVNHDHCYTQHFGLDFILTSQLELKLLEVNFRPELSYSDREEEKFKFGIFHDLVMHFHLGAEEAHLNWLPFSLND